jgi:putative inorganic carbon (HCO3(-)) transporter
MRKSIAKLVSPLIVFFVLAAFTVFLGILALTVNVNLSIAILVAMVIIPLIAAVVLYPKFGLIIFLIGAYFIMLVSRVGVNFPVGTLMDGLVLLLLIGVLISQKKAPHWEDFRSPITVVILIWISYNVLQVANPNAESRLAWVYTIRSTALFMLTYFIFVTQIRTVEFIRTIFKIWIALTLFAAIYAIKQEYIGFFDFEMRSIDTPELRTLLFIGGHWRKFSIFAEPVSFSYNMVISSILCIVLILGNLKFYKKVLLSICVSIFLLAMIFSGTRGAYPLLPAALFLLAILKFNKRVLIFFSFAVVLFIGLVFMPTSNQNIVRFQSAFRPSDDPSFNLRKANQKRIQPYIQTHPFGGGLGSTGTWGERFSPNSYLAQFPPDSGFVRVAVELGYIGLLIFCTFLFVILKTGIENYYSIQDPELKNYCLAMVLITFALAIGNYPQEALVQFPISIFFYLIISLIRITSILDQNTTVANHKNLIHD